MSLSPVSLVSPRVSFRGEDDTKSNIINAPGKFAAPPEEGDKVEISGEAAAGAEPKKSSLLKNIGIGAGVVVGALAASFGMFKWKGETWLASNASGIMTKIKKAIVKPGKWIDENIIQRLAGKGSKAADDVADAGEEATGAAAGQTEGAAEAAEGAAAKPAGEAAKGAAKPASEAAPAAEPSKAPENTAPKVEGEETPTKKL